MPPQIKPFQEIGKNLNTLCSWAENASNGGVFFMYFIQEDYRFVGNEILQ